VFSSPEERSIFKKESPAGRGKAFMKRENPK
jgi:hypothetical protein